MFEVHVHVAGISTGAQGLNSSTPVPRDIENVRVVEQTELQVIRTKGRHTPSRAISNTNLTLLISLNNSVRVSHWFKQTNQGPKLDWVACLGGQRNLSHASLS